MLGDKIRRGGLPIQQLEQPWPNQRQAHTLIFACLHCRHPVLDFRCGRFWLEGPPNSVAFIENVLAGVVRWDLISCYCTFGDAEKLRIQTVCERFSDFKEMRVQGADVRREVGVERINHGDGTGHIVTVNIGKLGTTKNVEMSEFAEGQRPKAL